MQPWAQRLASGQGRGTNFQPWAKLYLSDFLSALLPLCRNLWIQAKELVRSMKESQVRTHWTLWGCLCPVQGRQTKHIRQP